MAGRPPNMQPGPGGQRPQTGNPGPGGMPMNAGNRPMTGQQPGGMQNQGRPQGAVGNLFGGKN